MGKRLKYVPVSASASPKVTFSSPEGSITFEGIGSEVVVSSVQFEALTQASSEFKFCTENRIIVHDEVPDPVTESSTPGLPPIDDPDNTPEALSGVPKASAGQELATPKVTSKK